MFDRRRKNETLPRLCVVVLALSVPPVLWLWDLPPETFAGCGSYGYACPQVACFGVEISTDSGYTWREDSVFIYGPPQSAVYLYVRTVLGVLWGQVEGWSFGVRHDGSALEAAGGELTLNAVTAGGIQTVKCGYPPDFQDTQIRPCGYTQGVVIDYGSTGCTVSAPSVLVTSYACYRVVMPPAEGVYPVTLEFTDDVGDPPIDSIVVQGGQSKVPCKFDLTLNVYSTSSYYPTPSYCPLYLETPLACSQQGGGGGGGGGATFTFIGPETFTLPEGEDDPHTVRTADLDNDSDVDVVVGNRNGGVNVFLNNGSITGDFDLPFIVEVGFQPRALAIRDMDQDGWPDLIAGVAGVYRAGDFAGVNVIFNNGDGTFGGPRDVRKSLGWFAGPRTVELEGDIDGDGFVDAVVGEDLGLSPAVYVAFWDGAGFKDQVLRIEPPNFLESTYVAVGRLNQDAFWDIAVGGNAGTWIALGDGLGTFQAPYQLGTVAGGEGVTIADFNNDALLDLAVSDGASLLVHLNQRDDAEGRPDFLVGEVPAGSAEQILATDLDGDNDLDVCLTSVSNPIGLMIFTNDGNGTFSPMMDLLTIRSPRWVEASTINQDSQLDLVTCYTVNDQADQIAVFFKVIPFLRGDHDNDRRINLTDAVRILRELFRGGSATSCPESADADDDGFYNLTDAVFLLNWLFRSGPVPPAPGPAGPGASCGVDTGPVFRGCSSYDC